MVNEKISKNIRLTKEENANWDPEQVHRFLHDGGTTRAQSQLAGELITIIQWIQHECIRNQMERSNYNNRVKACIKTERLNISQNNIDQILFHDDGIGHNGAQYLVMFDDLPKPEMPLPKSITETPKGRAEYD